jgi:hypothetical protein
MPNTNNRSIEAKRLRTLYKGKAVTIRTVGSELEGKRGKVRDVKVEISGENTARLLEVSIEDTRYWLDPADVELDKLIGQ